MTWHLWNLRWGGDCGMLLSKAAKADLLGSEMDRQPSTSSRSLSLHWDRDALDQELRVP